jgi:hypothetical protein
MSISTYFRPNVHQNGLDILGVIFWCLAVAKTNDITCLHIEVVDSRYTKFVSPKDNRCIKAKKCRIWVCKCLLWRLEVDYSI